MWFLKLIVTFFFSIDSIIYNFIPVLYNLLIDISKASILSQADIKDFTSRVYILLGTFMLFKVAFSLIQYVVNPDDFSDKSKGIGQIGKNIIISLCLLVLTPYLFGYAYQLQTIILEENVLAKVILDYDSNNSDYLNTAGDTMSYITMSAFFKPNLSIPELSNCGNLVIEEDGKNKINPNCFGVRKSDGTFVEDKTITNSLYSIATDKTAILNYAAGVENKSLDLMFRLRLAKQTYMSSSAANSDEDDANEEQFIIEYQYIFSTVTGVIVALLLITFCLDVALRSVKLSFLQIVAPIPIISYIDPKSGKDGLFKKWYKMCFSTFLSLFIRLIAIYFAIYIISKLDDGMVNISTGAYITNPIIKIIIMIGVLMFAKQLPKILEGLGIKLDGEKFTLNPLKKIENEALGGKRLTGAIGGAAIGALGNKGNPLKALGGAFRGAAGNQGLSGSAKHQAQVNKELRQAKLDGSTLGGRMNARWTNFSGAKGLNNVEKDRKRMENLNAVATSLSDSENTAVEKIKNGEAGAISRQYLEMTAKAQHYRETGNIDEAVKYEMAASNYLNGQGKYDFMDVSSGAKNTYKKADGLDASGNLKFSADDVEATDSEKNGTVASKIEDYKAVATNKKQKVASDAENMHKQLGELKAETSQIERETSQKQKNNEADQKFVEASKIKKQ